MAFVESRTLVSVIIPTRNRADELARCLDSVYNSDYSELEVVVVDDASEAPIEPSLKARFPRVRFIRNERRMLLSCSRNRGADASKGSYLFFLDDDNVLAADTIRLLVQTLESSDHVAVSSPVIFYLARPTAVWTSYITRSPLPGFYSLHTDVPDVEKPTFSFHNSFMVKAAVFESLHGFDCANLPIRFSEVDFAHKVSDAGYTAVVNPWARDWHDLGWSLVHIDSTRAYYTERNRMIVIKRYFARRDFVFYCICILPFVTAYYLLHHPLSSSNGRLRTAENLLRGIVSGLVFKVASSGP